MGDAKVATGSYRVVVARHHSEESFSCDSLDCAFYCALAGEEYGDHYVKRIEQGGSPVAEWPVDPFSDRMAVYHDYLRRNPDVARQFGIDEDEL